MELTLKHYLNKYIVYVSHNKFELITRISDDTRDIDLKTGIFATDLEFKNLEQDQTVHVNHELNNKVRSDRYRFNTITQHAKLNQINLKIDDVANYLLNQEQSLTEDKSEVTKVHTMAKEVIEEILNPALGQKKLTKNEQLKLDAAKLSAHRKLELIKKIQKK